MKPENTGWNVPWQNQIILLNKPHKWSSFDVVNKLKYTLRLKMGHAGTLDPLATGLLILCTGKKLKEMEQFKELDKTYTGQLVLGATTASADLEHPVNEIFPVEHITHEMIYASAKKFLGESLQYPPVHSAVKREGVRYYKMARRGEEFKTQPRMVELKKIEITKIEMPLIEFSITCSKGFYVRSFVDEFGKALSSGAYLSALCRTQIGPYTLSESYDVESLVTTIKSARDQYYLSENEVSNSI